jgi:predicted deacylase
MRISDFHPKQLARRTKQRLLVEIDSDLSFPVLQVRGSEPGQTLVVSANVHGDEYEGVRAIFETFEELQPEHMTGDLLAVPVLNVPAFWSGTRTSPLDGANLARVFPGDPGGTPSQRLAWHFGRSILAHASFYLDLHSGGVKFSMPSMAGYSSTDARARAGAEVFGASVIWGHPTLEPGRTVSLAHELGIPWIYTEARGAGRIHPEDLAMMKRGVRNLLRHLRILSGPFETVPIEWRLFGDGNTDCGVSATQAGFLMPDVQILDRAAAGQRLGRLANVMGEVLEEYHAPVSGIVGLVREFPVVQKDDVLFLMAEEEHS